MSGSAFFGIIAIAFAIIVRSLQLGGEIVRCKPLGAETDDRVVPVTQVIRGARYPGIDDVAIMIVAQSCQAKGKFLPQRNVDYTFHFDTVVVAVQGHHVAGEFVGLRIIGDDVDGAAKCVAAIQCSLRSAQNFNAIDVEI